MICRNPGTNVVPTVVLECARALEAKLRRSSYVRQVKNRKEWFVTDPMFSFIQHGLKKGVTGYRVGYFFSAEEDELGFYLVHAPVMAKLFKNNLQISALVSAAKGCSVFCHKLRMYCNSRKVMRDGEHGIWIEDTPAAFLSILEELDERKFISDMFPRIKNQGKGNGHAKAAGNTFFLLLAEKASSLRPEDITTVVNSSWPLFLCLYPRSAIEHRVASLARSLVTAKLPKKCEYKRIIDRPSEYEISSLCQGTIQGAHIKPHSLGGSDRIENGLWLCQYHHRKTEGKLAGFRDGEKLNIRFAN